MGEEGHGKVGWGGLTWCEFFDAEGRHFGETVLFGWRISGRGIEN